MTEDMRAEHRIRPEDDSGPGAPTDRAPGATGQPDDAQTGGTATVAAPSDGAAGRVTSDQAATSAADPGPSEFGAEAEAVTRAAMASVAATEVNPPAPTGPTGPAEPEAPEIPAVPSPPSAPADPPAVEPAPSDPASPEPGPAAGPTLDPARIPGVRSGRPSTGRPGGRSQSRPGGPPVTMPAVEPTVEPTDPHKWGRIDEAGVVYVYGPMGERPVGNWQAGDADAGLAHFARRFDDFATEIALLETRLVSGSGDPKATRTHAIELRESVDSLAGIGDLDSAAARLEIVIGAADAAIAGAGAARAAVRAAAVAAKEALCEEAEKLAESEQWKSTGDRLKEIVDEWRTIKGIDRKTDDTLWKRFAKARDAFTRRRGTHFADLDKQRGAAREAKELLIARAEALSESTEWGRTAGDYRTLMEEWKASGRAPRDVEDALWNRFRAAQEKFFSHRNHTFSERDNEFESNAAVKEALLAEAEKIGTAGGLDAAKVALRSIQERWEAAGKVPRERIKEFDSRLRAVEDRIRSAEDSHWRRTDPETAARIEQFRSRAESYRSQAAKARAAGNERKAVEAEGQAAQWEEWLAAARGAVEL